MPDYHVHLMPNGIYHLLSRANGNEQLFREEENYRFFLEKASKYILPVADVFSYCLLPNHFHFLVQIKPVSVIQDNYLLMKHDKPFSDKEIPDFLMERFSNLLNSYSKSYNKMYKRKGGLFVDYLRRVEINAEKQVCNTVFYIHKNPVHHGYCNGLIEWKWSSYWAITNQNSEFVASNKVLKYFGNVELFQKFHNKTITPKSLF